MYWNNGELKAWICISELNLNIRCIEIGLLNGGWDTDGDVEP